MQPKQTLSTLTADNRPYHVFAIVFFCELLLVAIYWFDIATGGHFTLVHSLFDLDSEGNITAWFSSTQLFCVALAYWSCAIRKRNHRRPSIVFFALAGLAAVYASADETAQIHERVTALIGKRYIDWVPLYVAQNFWVAMVSVALLMTLCQLLADDLLLLWANYRRLSLIAGLGALSGGMGVETLGYKLLKGDTASLWYKMEVTVEEFMEMFGASLVLFSALKLRFHRLLVTSVATLSYSGFRQLRPARVE